VPTRIPTNPDGTRTCTQCGQAKPEDAYYSYPPRAGRPTPQRFGYCKDCARLRRRQRIDPQFRLVDVLVSR